MFVKVVSSFLEVSMKCIPLMFLEHHTIKIVMSVERYTSFPIGTMITSHVLCTWSLKINGLEFEECKYKQVMKIQLIVTCIYA